MINNEQFKEAAMTMIADLEMNHGLKLSESEMEKMIDSLVIVSMREYFRTKQFKKESKNI